MPTSTRLIRNAAILAKIEATTGTDSVPIPGTDAVLFSDLSITPLDSQNVDRNLIRPYLGASEMLIGPSTVKLSFSTELVGSGVVGTAPAWGVLARGLGLAQTLTASVRADYTPVSTAFETLSIYYYDDGVLHKLLAAQGSARIMIGIGAIPRIAFSFTGLRGAVSAATNPAVTLTSWRQPQVVQDSVTGDLTLGATHATATAPAFVGGTTYPSTGIEIDLGNQVVHNAFLKREAVDIVQRGVTGKIEIQATAAEEVSLTASAEAGTLTSVGLLHGTVANNKVGIWMPSCQLLNPSKGDRQGVRSVMFDLRALPVSGNDEIRLISSFA